jgi:hypothetical protein
MTAMQNTCISHLTRRALTSVVLVATVALGAVGVAAPAQAAGFSARVASIAHNAGDVTLTGTGDPGDLVAVTPSDGAPVEARVRPGGSWRVKAHVDGFGAHTFRVADSIGSPTADLRATTRPVSFTTIGVLRDNWHRALRVTGAGFEPRARIELAVDGTPAGTTTTDRDGAFAHRITGVAFGEHKVTTTERFDGAEQLRVDSSAKLEPFPVVDTVSVDPVGRTVHLEGRGPAGTEMRFVDESDAPWALTSGEDWVANADGTWSADLAYPAAGTRFMGIVAQVFDAGRLVGSTTTGATIPFPVRASVASYTPSRLVLTGTAEPGARLSFTDADGTPVTDADGNRVEPAVPGSSSWRVTLDPRRMSGGTVTVAATGDDGPLGSATVTYR